MLMIFHQFLSNGDEFSSIRITEGKYKDVIYQYGKVQFAQQETPEGQMPLQFQWTLKKKPDELDLDIDKEGFLVCDLTERSSIFP